MPFGLGEILNGNHRRLRPDSNIFCCGSHICTSAIIFIRPWKNFVELDINVLKRKKLLLYRQIKELEMEYEIGNINDEDFDSNRALLKQEVSAIITALDSK